MGSIYAPWVTHGMRRYTLILRISGNLISVYSFSLRISLKRAMVNELSDMATIVSLKRLGFPLSYNRSWSPTK